MCLLTEVKNKSCSCYNNLWPDVFFYVALSFTVLGGEKHLNSSTPKPIIDHLQTPFWKHLSIAL